MILNQLQILKKCNYFIDYNFDDAKQGVCTISWENNGIFQIKYNPKLESVVTNWKNQIIPCEVYGAHLVARMVLSDICQSYKYPQKWVNLRLRDNPTSLFHFPVDQSDKELEMGMNLEYLTNNLLTEGLQPDDVLLAKEFSIWDGFKKISEYHLGVKIDA